MPVVALAAAAGLALSGGRLALADADLTPRSAAQLLADLQRARLDQLSGTVVQTADLGLPQLPTIGGRGVSGGSGPATTSGATPAADLAVTGVNQMLSLVSGSHTWRVWYGGESRQRLALITALGESDVIHNGRDVWIWSSEERTATHLRLPEGSDPRARATGAATSMGLPTTLPATPEEAARLALAAIDPTTAVEVGPAVVVAGRTAYELVVKPKDSTTLVSQIRIAVDGERHLPLRAQVYSRKMATPAIEVGFTSIDFSAPEARQFDFTPPAGTTVTEADPAPMAQSAPEATHRIAEATKAPRVSGAGWSRVVVATLPGGAGSSAPLPDQLSRALPQVSGSWGSGRLLEGTLFSVVLSDDGRVAAGAVAPEALYAALAAR